jgi:xanthine dehydrogenase accessory factor
MNDLPEIAQALVRPRASGVLATLVSVEGSSYRRPGARMLLGPRGRVLGAISGGCLEEDLRLKAAAVLRSGTPATATYDTTGENDLLWGVGSGCSGVVTLLLEPVKGAQAWAAAALANARAGKATRLRVTWKGEPARLGTALAAEADSPGEGIFIDTLFPPTELTVFGAGDDARPLVRLAAGLGWRVVVADSRPRLATARRFPGAHAVVLGPAAELVARAVPRAGSLAVVMSHRYDIDRPVLGALLRLPLAYVGLLGPRLRAEKVLGDIETQQGPVPEAARQALHAPVGLDLGAEGPEEIALSIMAEMKAALAGRDGRPLRDRPLPIHG